MLLPAVTEAWNYCPSRQEIPIGQSSNTRPYRGALQLYARLGYAARGVVYLLVGGLATLAAFNQGGETTDSRGALRSLLTAPAGETLLVIISVGLIGYALWRCLQGLLDADRHGTSPKGLFIRSGLLLSAVTHGLLAVFAFSLVFTLGQSGGGGSGDPVRWLMQQPFGQWLVGIAGAVLLAAGLAHMFKGATKGFDKHLVMAEDTKRWAYPVCRFGLVTRGVVFVIAGFLFVTAALYANPNQAGGMAEVFSLLRNQMFGRWLLAIVSIGLFAFGIYSLLLSVYRRIDPDPGD